MWYTSFCLFLSPNVAATSSPYVLQDGTQVHTPSNQHQHGMLTHKTGLVPFV